MSFLDSTLGIIVSILVLLGIGAAVNYVYKSIYKKTTKVVTKGSDNVTIGDDNDIRDSFNRKP